MKSIAIDREYGSGGREVGKLISEKTGIPCYDGELMIEAAENYGLNVEMLRNYDEKNIGSLLYVIAMMNKSMSLDERNNKNNQVHAAYYAISETIRRISSNGPAVFIGRCAGEILRDGQRVVNAFLYASDREQKKQRAVALDQMTEANAEYALKKKDKQRKSFYEFFANKKWGDYQNYDMMLNTSSLGYEACADILIAAAQK